MSRFVYIAVSIIVCTALVPIVAYAQIIVGNDRYYTSAATINTDLRGNNIIVGRTPGFANPDTDILMPYAVTVATGAMSDYAVGSPKDYQGFEARSVSTVNVTGGELDRLSGYDASTLNIEGGRITTASAGQASTLNIRGGDLRNANVYSNSILNVSGGDIFALTGYQSSAVNISGGSVSAVRANNESVINIGKGSLVFDITALDTSSINVRGGVVGGVDATSFNTVSITGGKVSSARSFFKSVVNIADGDVSEAFGLDDSVINISGGDVSSIYGFGGAVNITGGAVAPGPLRFAGFGVANITGYGLALSSTSTKGNDLYGDYTEYKLSGVLPGEHSLSGVAFRDYDDEYEITNPSNPNGPTSPLNFFNLTASAPEPGTLALLGIALPLAGVVRARRKSRRQ